MGGDGNDPFKHRMHDLHRRIDIASISDSASTRTMTTVGLGAVTGRGLMMLGDVTLRGLRGVNLRLRLRTITTQLSTNNPSTIPAEVYEVLLELQRSVLLSRWLHV